MAAETPEAILAECDLLKSQQYTAVDRSASANIKQNEEMAYMGRIGKASSHSITSSLKVN